MKNLAALVKNPKKTKKKFCLQMHVLTAAQKIKELLQSARTRGCQMVLFSNQKYQFG
jgi:cell division septation protein DedD